MVQCDKETLCSSSRRIHVPQRSGTAVERIDRALSISYRARSWSIHSGIAGTGLSVQAVKAYLPFGVADRAAFLLVAPLPLQLHLGHPERSFEMYLTPHGSSAMRCSASSTCVSAGGACAGDLAGLPYDIVVLSQRPPAAAFAVSHIDARLDQYQPAALHIDERAGWLITVIGIPWLSYCTDTLALFLAR